MVFSDFPLKLSLLWILSQLYKYNYLNGLFVFLTTISKTNFKDIKKILFTNLNWNIENAYE